MNKLKNTWKQLSKTNKAIVVSLGGLITILSLIVLLDEVRQILTNMIEYIERNTGSARGGS